MSMWGCRHCQAVGPGGRGEWTQHYLDAHWRHEPTRTSEQIEWFGGNDE